MKDKKLHMIGNAHLDPVWLWNWQEGFQEVKATFRSALDRMNEDENFVFTCSSAAFYEWVEHNNPQMFEEIKKRVEEGRWEVVGGWWIQPDCNIPSGEAFARQGLYGQRYFKEKLNTLATTGYNVDSFGHNGNLPQILKKSGLDNYVFMRPMPLEKGLPGRTFWWKSMDGSSVMTYRIPYEYCSWGKELEKYTQRLKCELQDGEEELMMFYGVGNHGGGPTIDNIHTIYEMRKEREDVTMDFSTIGEFFEQVEPDRIPVVSREMGRIFFGCYSSDCEIKTLLFNQFHDVLAGTSIEPARNRTCMELGGVVAAAEEITEDAVQAIANRLDTRGDGFPLLLVNPTGTDYRGVCGASVYVPRAEKKNTRMRDAAGKEIACAESSYDNFAPEARKFLLFEAEIPAYGYVIYRVISEGPDLPEEESTLTAQEDLLDNGVIRVSFDRTAGAPTSIVKEGRELLTGSGSFAVYYDDRGSWGEHVWEEKVCGVFHVTGRKVVEVNQMRAILRFFLEYGKSEMMVDYILEKGSDRLKMRLKLRSAEKQRMITYNLPIAAECPRVFTETAFLAEDKIDCFDSNMEHYHHRFADITESGDGSGVAVLNNCIYGFLQKGAEYRLILLRSSSFARGGRGELEQNLEGRFMNQGCYDYELMLIPHEGQMKKKRLFAEADFLHMPVSYMGDSNHVGKEWLRCGSILSIDKDNHVHVSSVKTSEYDRGELVVRLFETEGTNSSASVSADGVQESLEFAPYEIKTLRLTADGWKACSMIEYC